MKHHIRCFKSEADFTNYNNSDDRWKPLVAFVPTTPVSNVNQITKDTPGRIVFQKLGTKFFEVLNGGNAYFTDTEDSSAWLDSNGQIHISTTNPEDAKIVGDAIKLTV